jgi:hypothetical protein
MTSEQQLKLTSGYWPDDHEPRRVCPLECMAGTFDVEVWAASYNPEAIREALNRGIRIGMRSSTKRGCRSLRFQSRFKQCKEPVVH